MNKIGLVGCGNWGKNILRDLISLGCQVAVADIDSAARNLAAAGGALLVVPDIDDLPECDGYVVAVPIPELTPQTARLLKFKKPIFAEKTLCRSMQDVSVLRKAGGDKLVFCMHKWHYHPGIEALRQVSQAGKIGAIEELHTTRTGWVDDFHGGDVFWTLAVHDLTIIKHITGCIPDQTAAINVIQEENGLAVSLLAVMGAKPVVVMNVNGRHCQKVSAVSLHGSKGCLMLQDAYDDHLTFRGEKGIEKIAIDTTFPLLLELAEFVKYLDNGPRPRCGLEQAEEVTRALLNLRERAGVASSE